MVASSEQPVDQTPAGPEAIKTRISNLTEHERSGVLPVNCVPSSEACKPANSATSGMQKLFLAGLQEILDSNGWDQASLVHSNDQLQRIEMFLTSYHSLVCLDLFPHLTSLELVGQAVDSLEGLSGCPALQKLWITDAKITSLKGLAGSVPSLTHLYLYGNHIEAIEHLDHLTHLEVLWLAQNRLQRIDGLETLLSLRELNLARNPIVCIASALRCNSALATLNLADSNVRARSPRCVALVQFAERNTMSSCRLPRSKRRAGLPSCQPCASCTLATRTGAPHP